MYDVETMGEEDLQEDELRDVVNALIEYREGETLRKFVHVSNKPL